jgi:hypothetical protein
VAKVASASVQAAAILLNFMAMWDMHQACSLRILRTPASHCNCENGQQTQ